MTGKIIVARAHTIKIVKKFNELPVVCLDKKPDIDDWDIKAIQKDTKLIGSIIHLALTCTDCFDLSAIILPHNNLQFPSDNNLV